jgi:hypothetical protein
MALPVRLRARKLEHLAQEHQDDDHRCRLEVDGHLAIMLHFLGEEIGHEQRHGAEGECSTHTDGDEGEHVQMTGNDRSPPSLKKWPPGPPDDRYGECALNPPRHRPFDPGVMGECRYHMGHREEEHGNGQCGTDPHAQGHVTQFSAILVLIPCSWRLHFQRHAALRAIARMILLDLRVHRAGVDGFALGPCGRCRSRRRQEGL